ncbi:LTA synthase family protein [Pollutibacter soli]|uniref:LTA synthase family protein n=1 Tax=Pollutibacter soli TaxID=3034157 RepID=UPI003013C7A6
MFWQEFESRFNFIAVDYLVYTYEVVSNINQSYPLPILIGSILIIVTIIQFLFEKRRYFQKSFRGNTVLKDRVVLSSVFSSVILIFALGINNSFAEKSTNRYQNELAKAGIYSFFSAFRNNELNYDAFYKRLDNKSAFEVVRRQLKNPSSYFESDSFSIGRKIADSGQSINPNVIMITIESFSADFMTRFGNREGLTPVLDSLAEKSILFTNMYATGTRTVRGMEALSVAIPPTPGNSIVRRQHNEQLTTIGSIFRDKRYNTGFFYGGDGYFDNMNQYFGNNGYTVTDRKRSGIIAEQFAAERHPIPDSLVNFENAWGICDEDLYDAVIRDADAQMAQGKAFYDFVMTTSNHRPYTYPAGRIDIPSGTGRSGAVKYTDYAIGRFFEKIRSKPWYKNTIIILVADHCASSAGKNEIDVSKYHIPAMVVNMPMPPTAIDQLCSQIDLYPTLFSMFNWNYQSNLYGQDVLSPEYVPRAFLGTYQKLAYLQHDSVVILSPQQKVESFKYSFASNEQKPIHLPSDNPVVMEAVANYQTAYYLFKNGGLKEHPSLADTARQAGTTGLQYKVSKAGN